MINQTEKLKKKERNQRLGKMSTIRRVLAKANNSLISAKSNKKKHELKNFEEKESS